MVLRVRLLRGDEVGERLVDLGGPTVAVVRLRLDFRDVRVEFHDLIEVRAQTGTHELRSAGGVDVTLCGVRCVHGAQLDGFRGLRALVRGRCGLRRAFRRCRHDEPFRFA